MKREIKFRAKRLIEGNPTDIWAYGSLRCDYGGIDYSSVFYRDESPELYSVGIRACQIYDPKTHSTYAVNSDSVGQYTGLKDKNGTEIYEGDIVNWLSIRNGGTGFIEEGVVEFRVNEQAYVVINRIKTRDNRELVCNILRCRRDLKVIGNVYDNPELITEL